jgi:transposase
MILSFKEKKELAINLIEQGVSTREIARQIHLSYSTIGKIRKELEGYTSENNKKPLSISSQAFKLFEKYKTPWTILESEFIKEKLNYLS